MEYKTIGELRGALLQLMSQLRREERAKRALGEALNGANIRATVRAYTRPKGGQA